MDARFKHPLTGIIAGPSGGGKTTFIAKLLKNASIYFDTDFKYITFYIGTLLSENPIIKAFIEEDKTRKSSVVEVNAKYKGKEFQENFEKDFLNHCKEKGREGCIVFDDMMSELSKCGLLSDLFSKHSSHFSLTIFHITQNLFFKGKDPNEHVTLYRNTHMLVLFKNPLDSTIISTVARRLATGDKFRKLVSMFHAVLDKYRYIIINGGFKRDAKLQFISDIFNTDPILHQKVFFTDDSALSNERIHSQKSKRS